MANICRQHFRKLQLLSFLKIIIVNTRCYFRKLFLLKLVASISKHVISNVSKIIIASISENYDCQHFWKLQLLTFPKLYFQDSGNLYLLTVLKIIIAILSENIVVNIRRHFRKNIIMRIVNISRQHF